MKPLSEGSETSHSDRIYIADVQRRGFSLIDQNILKLGGFELKTNFRYFGIFIQHFFRGTLV